MTREEWHLFRRQGIGGSDAPVIHGLSKYRKYHELLAEKSSLEIKDSPSNFIQQIGHSTEPKLRAFFCLNWINERGVEDPFDAELVIHPKKEFLRASLDGLSKDRKTFIECKVVGANVLRSGVVPIAYYIQVQHQYLCSGAEEGFVVMCNMKGQGMKIIPVPRDDSFIEIHKRKAKEFWALVEANRKLLQNPSGLAIIEGEVQNET